MANYTWMTTTALSSTAADFGNELMDNVFDANNTLKAIKKYGGLVDRSGGKEFTVPAIKEAGNAQWFTRASKIADTMPDPVHTLTYEMKYFQVPCKVYWTDEVENRGSKTKIFDFVKAQQEVAKMTSETEIEDAIWRAAPLANSCNSIPMLVSATQEVGECDPAAHTWFVSQSDTVGSFATNGIDKMQEMLTDLYVEKAKIDAIFMGPTVYNYYIGEAEDKHLLMNDGSKMGFGIGKVPFAGVPVEIGRAVPSGSIYFLDFSTIKIRRNSAATEMTEWQDMENEMARKAHYLFALQPFIQIRKRNGVLSSITA